MCVTIVNVIQNMPLSIFNGLIYICYLNFVLVI